MAFKFVHFATILVVVRAGNPLGYSAGLPNTYPGLLAPAAHYASSGNAPSGYAVTNYNGVSLHALPLTRTYAAPAQLTDTYSAAAPVTHTYSAAVPVTHTYTSAVPAARTYAAVSPSSHTYVAGSTSYATPSIPKIASYDAPSVPFALPHLAKAYTAPIAYSAPVAKAVYAEPSTPAHYDFGYSVSDPHTGDTKSQQESRRGDVVQGSYSLIESDGTKRIVEYTADSHNGFNAIVHKEPAAVAVKAAVPVAAKYISSAPVAHAALATYASPLVKYTAPLSYAAPVSKVASYTAPAAYAAAPSHYH